MQQFAKIITTYLNDKNPDLTFYKNEVYQLKKSIQINSLF